MENFIFCAVDSSRILVVTRFTILSLWLLQDITILLLLWTENLGKVEVTPFSSINDTISYSTQIFIKMASFMALVYGPGFNLLRIFIFFVCKCYLKKAHMQGQLFLSSMHVNYTLMAHHPPKNTNKARKRANKL